MEASPEPDEQPTAEKLDENAKTASDLNAHSLSLSGNHERCNPVDSQLTSSARSEGKRTKKTSSPGCFNIMMTAFTAFGAFFQGSWLPTFQQADISQLRRPVAVHDITPGPHFSYPCQAPCSVPTVHPSSCSFRLPNIVIYTDAACKESSKKKNTVGETGIGGYFGDDDKRNFSEKLEKPVSNMEGEVEAAIRALRIVGNVECRGKQRVIIKTDCLAMVQMMSHRPINLEKIEKPHLCSVYKRLLEHVNNLPRCMTVVFEHVQSHSDQADSADRHGNRQADTLARAAIGLEPNGRIKKTWTKVKGRKQCSYHDECNDRNCPQSQ